jgi:glycosyltransferase involved in cell wall biosynthesis
MKIAVITCYDQNDYVRARTLRAAFGAMDGMETIVVRNTQKGVLRYPEVMWKILKLRFGVRPDAYVITFRGYEMLLFMRLTLMRKPIIFDELINMVEYYREHGKLRADTAPDNIARRLYHWMVRGCKVVLADTQAHADYSAGVSRVPLKQYRILPIAADESLFFPGAPAARPAPGEPDKTFTVFYYGNGMTPLHGLQYVLDAAVLLKDYPQIRFSVAGGRGSVAGICAEAVTKGAHLSYEDWVDSDEIPNRARTASLCLGGPFGKTLQSQFVITGKATQFMACASPVIIGKNKVSGMFRDRENCLLVELADAQALADAVLWAYKHPAELQKIGRAGRKLYESDFSQAVADNVLSGIVTDLRRR